MPQMDLRIESEQNGVEDEDGMRLLELEDTLTAIRQAGGKDTTRLKVDTSRRSRIRVVTGQLRADDADVDRVAEGTGTPVDGINLGGRRSVAEQSPDQ